MKAADAHTSDATPSLLQRRDVSSTGTQPELSQSASNFGTANDPGVHTDKETSPMTGLNDSNSKNVRPSLIVNYNKRKRLPRRCKKNIVYKE